MSVIPLSDVTSVEEIDPWELLGWGFWKKTFFFVTCGFIGILIPFSLDNGYLYYVLSGVGIFILFILVWVFWYDLLDLFGIEYHLPFSVPLAIYAIIPEDEIWNFYWVPSWMIDDEHVYVSTGIPTENLYE